MEELLDVTFAMDDGKPNQAHKNIIIYLSADEVQEHQVFLIPTGSLHQLGGAGWLHFGKVSVS